MSLLTALRYRLRVLLHPEQHARELDEEMRFHLSLDALEHDGSERDVPPADSRRRFGNVTRYKEETHDMTGQDFVDTARQDFRFAWRTLKHAPGFATVAVLTIALGIGATAAIFSVVNAVVLRPLPYPAADRVITVWMDNRRQGNHEDIFSYPNFADLEAQNRSFDHLAAYRLAGVNLTGAGEPQRVIAGLLSADAFAALGMQPVLGRLYTAENESAGADNVAVISYGLWQSQFAGDPSVIGRSVELNGRNSTILGVMPRDFAFPSERTQIWTPLVVSDGLKTARGAYAFYALGRLKPGVSIEQARADMGTIAQRLEREYPENRGLGVNLISLPEQVVGPTLRTALWLMLGAVAAVLLIACANVANLLLSRAAVREREVTVRMALGASSRRLVRQFLTESLLLSLIGGTLGLALGVIGVRVLRALAPADLPRAAAIELDGAVVAVTLLATLATGVLFGLVPALQSSRTAMSETLREGGRGASSGRGGQRLRRSIVGAQLALVVVLLTGATLLTRTFIALQRVDLGFDSHNVLAMSIQLPATKYQQPPQAAAFFETLLDRLRATPGVKSAGTVSTLLLSSLPSSGLITADSRAHLPTDEEVTFDVADTGFFNTIGAHIVRGRGFTSADRDGSLPVAVINDRLAKRYWPDGNAVGRRFTFGDAVRDTLNNPWITIVGVVNDMKRTGADAAVREQLFQPYEQSRSRGNTVLVKTAGDPMSMMPAVRQIVRALDADQPIANIGTVDQMLDNRVAQRRFSMTLVGIFAGLAFVLAIIGAYGVTSYLVSQRTREIGVRLALGAPPSRVARHVVLDGMRVVVIGVIVGIAGAMLTTRLVASLLFGVSARDPLTISGVAVGLLAVGALANYLPARRAAQVDPLLALRQD